MFIQRLVASPELMRYQSLVSLVEMDLAGLEF
jgi:hypothetical protein